MELPIIIKSASRILLLYYFTDNLPKRIENINNYFTFSLYSNVCRSLFEKDKLMFAFLLCTRIQAHQGLIAPVGVSIEYLHMSVNLKYLYTSVNTEYVHVTVKTECLHISVNIEYIGVNIEHLYISVNAECSLHYKVWAWCCTPAVYIGVRIVTLNYASL